MDLLQNKRKEIFQYRKYTLSLLESYQLPIKKYSPLDKLCVVMPLIRADMWPPRETTALDGFHSLGL